LQTQELRPLAYAGFDRFGRVIEQLWRDYGASAGRNEHTHGRGRPGADEAERRHRQDAAFHRPISLLKGIKAGKADLASGATSSLPEVHPIVT